MSIAACWLELSWSFPSRPHPQPLETLPSGYMSLACRGDFNLRSPFHTQVIREVEKMFPGKRFLYCQQEHTKIVRPVRMDDEPGQLGDGLVTRDDRVLLGITVADCLPILLWDPEHGVRGLLHSGWKGTGILKEAVLLMRNLYGTDPEALHVLFGPCIRACCYRVDAQRGQWFQSQFGNGAAESRDDGYYLNLMQANRNIAQEMGIRMIEEVKGCTCCDSRFHSYRREGPSSFQRMLVLF